MRKKRARSRRPSFALEHAYALVHADLLKRGEEIHGDALLAVRAAHRLVEHEMAVGRRKGR